MDLGKNNYLKNRIVTTIVSKLISHESGVRLALPYLLLFSMEICWSLWPDGEIPNVFNTNQALVPSTRQ